MPSLTPQQRSDEVTWSATYEGLITGGMALVPSTGAVFLAMKTSPRFVKATNWQSRTALVIMPALFAFGFASESKLIHRMHEVADETEHAKNVAKWSLENHPHPANPANATATGKLQRELEIEAQLTKLYRDSVEHSGVRIVPGDTLKPHQNALNYFNDNPVKVLAAIGIPTVGSIFYGRAGKDHLSASMKIMHTRVMGQFAVIGILLSLMGFKEYMNRNGKVITEQQADIRVEEMKRVRQDLLMRMQAENMALQAQREQINQAHEQDVQEGNVHHHSKKTPEPLPLTMKTVVATSSQP